MAAGLSLLGLGCSATDSGSPSEESDLLTAGEIATSFDEFQLLAEQMGEVIGLLMFTEDAILSECMQREGFFFPQRPPVQDEDVERSRTLLQTSVDLDGWNPEEDGYNLQGDDERAAPLVPELDEYLDALSESDRAAYDRALLGDGREISVESDDAIQVSEPANGCLYEARSQSRGSDESMSRYSIVEAQVQLIGAIPVDASPGVIEAEGNWRRCMGEAGYDVATPDEASGYAYEQGLPFSEERAMAVTDKGCRESSGVSDAMLAAYKRGVAEAMARPETEALLLEWAEVSALVRQASLDVLEARGFDTDVLAAGEG